MKYATLRYDTVEVENRLKHLEHVENRLKNLCEQTY